MNLERLKMRHNRAQYPFSRIIVKARRGFRIALLATVASLLAACDNAEEIPNILLNDTNGYSALLSPRIVASNPAGNGGTYPGSVDIFADFSVPMDTEVTRNTFSVTGAASPSGRTVWEGNQRIKFELDEDLTSGNSYIMKVGRSAKSADGYLLNVDHLVYFTVGSTINGPTVVSSTPADNDQAVDVSSTIRVIFSRVMDQASTESAFSISPSASGTFAWDADGLGFTYTPYTDLTFATTYSVTVGVGATDTEGIPLASSHNFSFQAGTDFTNPTITAVRESGGVVDIPDYGTGVFKDAAFVVYFDEAMDYSSTESAFSITRLADSSSVSGTFAWAATFQDVTFTPDSPLEPESWYLLEVSTSATDVSGNSPDNPLQVHFYVDNSGTYSGTPAAHSNYLTLTRVDKTTPAPAQINLTPIDNVTLHTVTLSAPPQALVLDVVFDNSLDPGSIGSNVTLTKLVDKFGTATPTLQGLSLFNDGAGTNNGLRIAIDNFDQTDYLIKIVSGSGGVLSDPTASPGETGTWLQNDINIYLRGN